MRPYEAWSNFRQEFRAQESRAILWIVVAFAAGIALFFGWATDPPVWAAPGAALSAALFLKVRWERPLVIAVIAIGTGHSVAHFRTTQVAPPLRTKEVAP